MEQKRITACRRWIAAASGLILALGLVAVDSAMAGDVSRRMERDINLMEEIVSDLLVESPYWLVSSGGPAYGVYVDGFGVIINFRASLVSGSSWSRKRHGFSILGGLFKDRIIIHDDDDDDYYDDDFDDDEEYEKWRDRRKRRESRCYEKGKQELYDLLTDVGDLLDELGDEEWVAMAVFLEDHRYFRKNKLSRLFLKVRAADMRALEAGRITTEEFTQRVVEDEY
jgi:hypothetical protein